MKMSKKMNPTEKAYQAWVESICKLKWFFKQILGKTETKTANVNVEPLHGSLINQPKPVLTKKSVLILESSTTVRHHHKSSLLDRKNSNEFLTQPVVNRQSSKQLILPGPDLDS